MCALSVLQKECRKVWGARYTLGARYRSENTVLVLQLQFTHQTRHTELHFKPTINFSHAVLWLALTLILDYKKHVV